MLLVFLGLWIGGCDLVFYMTGYLLTFRIRGTDESLKAFGLGSYTVTLYAAVCPKVELLGAGIWRGY